MRILFQLAWLGGIQILLAGMLYSQDNVPAGLVSRGLLPRASSVAKQVAGSSGGRGNRADLSQAAEDSARKARLLRQKQTSRDLAAAIEYFRKSARLFEAASQDTQAAEAYLQIGDIYFVLSNYVKALYSYSQALRLSGSNVELRSSALSHKARVYATKGRKSEANRFSEMALALSDDISSQKIQGEAQQARGEALFSSGNTSEALEHFTRARDLFAAAQDADGEALAELKMAETFSERGESGQVIRLATEAWKTWSTAGNSYGVGRARAFLGLVSISTGQFETAQCHYEQALAKFQEVGDRDQSAVLLNTLGYTSLQMGDAEKSFEYGRQARRTFAVVQDHLGEAAALTVMGEALTALRRYRELPGLLSAELRLAQESNNQRMIALALADMAVVRERTRQYPQAETLYQKSLREYRQAHNVVGESDVLILMAQLASREARYTRALSLLELARPLKEQLNQVGALAKIDYELASVYRQLGRPDDALQAIQRTISVIETQRLKITDFDSRAAYFSSVHKYYALYVDLVMHQANDPLFASTAKAFEASERSKVRSLLDWLAASRQLVSCEELVAKQIEMIEAEPGPTAQPDESFPTPENALTLTEIQAEIAGDDAILLEYALGDAKSYLWVVTGNQVSAHELPPAPRLAELIQRYRGALTAQLPRAEESNNAYLARLRNAERDYPKLAADLSHLLLGPAQLGSAKRVIIVPEGALQYVPFDALLVPDQKGGMVALAADHDVIGLPSASALGALRKLVARRPQPTAAAAVFADPVFDRDDPRIHPLPVRLAPGKESTRSSTAREAWRSVHGSARIMPLPASHEEARAVQALGQDVYVAEGFLASRETVLHHDLGSYRVIHFATHGILDEKHPEQSGLILSLLNEKRQPVDGYLRLSDIYKLKLSADLVVLSSCESGLGKDLSSEGIIGLPRAFLRAGAKSVIATLWKVEDRATATLMTYFYAGLSQGESPASALRKAQTQLSRDPRWSAPYYWAAFVLQGDYR